MKVKVSFIDANPYRKIDTYPIDRAKVDALKTSIRETDFWDNILVRKSPKNPGRYELAYGHHRITAVRELDIEEIDIPVKDLDDATMLRIMAGENMDIYKSDPRIINETVQVAKEFIDAELAKYGTWEECKEKGAIFSTLFENMALKPTAAGNLKNPKAIFGQAKGQGAGRDLICAFLGGNWKPWKVEAALSIIRDDSVDRKATEKFNSMDASNNFAAAVKKHNIPKEEQAELAERIITESQDKSKKIPDAVAQYVREKVNEKVKQEGGIVSYKDPEIEKLKDSIARTKKTAAALSVCIRDTIEIMDNLKVESMRGVELLSMKVSMSEVIEAIKRLEQKTGVSFHKREGRE